MIWTPIPSPHLPLSQYAHMYLSSLWPRPTRQPHVPTSPDVYTSPLSPCCGLTRKHTKMLLQVYGYGLTGFSQDEIKDWLSTAQTLVVSMLALKKRNSALFHVS